MKVFIARYLVHLNGGRAAVEAGYSSHTARSIACELLQKPEIAAAIQKAMDERAARNELDADAILQKWKTIEEADPGELINVRRGACRYCWGKNHLYQRTPKELREAIEEFNQVKAQADTPGKKFAGVFDQQGGIGYDPRKDPCPSCPECHGRGEPDVFINDLRDVSPAARRLFAGVKKSDKGIEIKLRDQDGALKNIAQHLGMLQQKVKHSNDPDNPMPSGVVMIPMKDPVDGSGGG